MTFTSSTLHKSVLLDEAITGLAIKEDGNYIDGTFGRGGHSRAILAKLGDKGRLLAIDQDPEAVTYAHQHFADDQRLIVQSGSFTALKEFAESIFTTPVDGILLDLGVSSPQLDTAARGFSFMQDGPLDMRLNPQKGLSAAEWLAEVDEQKLAQVLWEYGEERFSRRIARTIAQTRIETPITTTLALANLIAKAVPTREPHKHPATRSFQAIRIAINDELGALQKALNAALDTLKPGGRLAVISFHSLEDRLVKHFMQLYAHGNPVLRSLPLSDAQRGIRLKLIGKAIKPTQQEIAHNPRARSAILRIGEKL
jgi:16S rRNA (cytosine1402-N4)-methyltransferase